MLIVGLSFLRGIESRYSNVLLLARYTVRAFCYDPARFSFGDLVSVILDEL